MMMKWLTVFSDWQGGLVLDVLDLQSCTGHLDEFQFAMIKWVTGWLTGMYV
jgi:hypothetical protein